MGQLGRTQKSRAPAEEKLKAYACELEQKLEARTRELSEAREQEAATAEVLRIISSSPGELELVFDAMLRNAVRICGAKYGMLSLCKGEEARSARIRRPAVGDARWCADLVSRSDAERERAGRLYHHLSAGAGAVHRKAHWTGYELRRPGRHRHRKHPPAQRAARIATAADCDRR